MFIKCLSNIEVAFKIIIGHVIDQMVILKAISLFDGHFIDIYMTYRITQKCPTFITKNTLINMNYDPLKLICSDLKKLEQVIINDHL
jgi:hypothetical protein